MKKLFSAGFLILVMNSITLSQNYQFLNLDSGWFFSDDSTGITNAAAIGEMVYGNAKGMDFIVITLGIEVGSDLVVYGGMVYDHDDFAGEVGHTTVYPGGRMCGCRKKAV